MGRKILLIEDDAETAGYIAKGLSEQGHVVDHVADGREGLFLASDASFDLVILDRMLPGLDGLGVLRALRAAGVETPVLILSALAMRCSGARRARRTARPRTGLSSAISKSICSRGPCIAPAGRST